MNLSALPELLLAWAKTQGAALLQGNKAEAPSPFKVGADYAGKVLDQLPGGRHLVQVAGQKLDMALPRNTQAGDTVRLTFINAGPRPTFLLQQAPVSAVQQVQLSSTAQQVNALMRLNPGAAASPAEAQAASQVQAAPKASAANLPTPVPAQVASGRGIPPGLTMAGPAAASSPAAASASNASNAASPGNAAAPSAAMGRPIVANVLMLQTPPPQSTGSLPALASANTALLGQSVDSLRAAVSASTNLRPTVLASPATPSPDLLPQRLAQTVKESGLFYESHLARWTRGSYAFESLLNEPQARLARGQVPMANLAELAGMPDEAARLAGRQLHMLEGAPFLWQGFAWPGQWMDWLVQERPGGEGEGPGQEDAAAWTTELRLTLPRMGLVEARLDLRDKDVGLALKANDGATAEQLQAALGVLREQLENAGLQVARLSVEVASP